MATNSFLIGIYINYLHNKEKKKQFGHFYFYFSEFFFCITQNNLSFVFHFIFFFVTADLY